MVQSRIVVRRKKKLTVGLVFTAMLLAGLVNRPAVADVSEVTGSAYGYFTSVGLFGGPAGDKGPAPQVTLPSTGGDESASLPSASAQYGPAVIFQSGALNVSTVGSTGADGSVTSSSQIAGAANPEDRPGPFLYDDVSSTCTANEEGVSASSTIVNGILETSYDAVSQEPLTTVELPENPAPNTEYEGTIDHVGDRYRIVFNEQVIEGNTITVNAAHMYLLGDIAVGDVIIGQSVCGVVGTGSTPTTPTTPTTLTDPTTPPTVTPRTPVKAPPAVPVVAQPKFTG